MQQHRARAIIKHLNQSSAPFLTLPPYTHPPTHPPTSRQETLGFQFWQGGFWKDHLRGRPYHISALYVVDLQRFRRNAVGDQLRAVYDQLARDPNSLANLDQGMEGECGMGSDG